MSFSIPVPSTLLVLFFMRMCFWCYFLLNQFECGCAESSSDEAESELQGEWAKRVGARAS